MKILIAVDSFKGSLSSYKAGEAISLGVKRVFPEASTEIITIADGGEGTVEAIIMAEKGRIWTTPTTSPIGETVDSIIGQLPNGTVVLEMASASGLPLVPKDKRNPLLTTTFGTGELIRKSLDLGAREIVIGIGGSATNDGGAGMAKALGVKFLAPDGFEIEQGGGSLGSIETIDISGVDPRLNNTKITVMCDVNNPLCGPNGASAVYGPQKGATLQMVELLDHNLFHYAKKINEQLNIDILNVPGAGAAGGLGAGLMAFTGAELKTGIEVILNTVRFDERLKEVDIVVTGEGQLDGQSIHGKVPVGVGSRAKKLHKPVLAIVGSIGHGTELLYKTGLDALQTIVNGPISLEESMEKAFELTVEATERAFRLIKVGMFNKE